MSIRNFHHMLCNSSEERKFSGLSLIMDNHCWFVPYDMYYLNTFEAKEKRQKRTHIFIGTPLCGTPRRFPVPFQNFSVSFLRNSYNKTN